jgi:hypothetical protein
MSYLDPYEITASTTPPPRQAEQSFDQELSDVVSQLNSFWSGFKKQASTQHP